MQFMYLALGGACLTIGDVLMKRWSLTDALTWFGCGFIAWVIGLLFLAATFKQMNIAIASVIFVFINVGLLSLVEKFWFDTPMSMGKLIGMLLGLAAIAIMELA